MSRPPLSLIAAVARNGGIGRDNALLVRLSEDLAHFKRTTLGHPVVMGRRTWESIGRALPGRRNVVVTRDPAFVAPGAETAPSLEAALERLGGAERVFVIGGAALYAAALPRADELVLTEIDADLEADVFFPQWNRAEFRQTSREPHRSVDGLPYTIVHYKRVAQGE
jgi:dihydrofolate reductase